MNHTTHFDDCGCKSTKIQEEIDVLKAELSRVTEKLELALSFIEVNKGYATPTVAANKFIKHIRSDKLTRDKSSQDGKK